MTIYTINAEKLPAVLNLEYANFDREDLARLYEKAKIFQWNASTEIDWSKDVDPEKGILEDSRIPIYGTPFWDRLDARRQRDLNYAQSAWALSQFLHGELITLVACGQIVAGIPTMEGKLYLATQVMDEGRHVEAYRRYLLEKVERVYPMSDTLKALAGIMLADSRWYVKLIGIQLILEALALSAFRGIAKNAKDELVKDVIRYVMKDESRHVAFGVAALRDFVVELPEKEREELAEMAYESCGLMMTGFFSREIFEEIGCSASEMEEIAQAVKVSPIAKDFRDDMRRVLAPNLSRVGLMTDKIRPRYEKVRMTDFASFPLVYEEGGGLGEF